MVTGTLHAGLVCLTGRRHRKPVDQVRYGMICKHQMDSSKSEKMVKEKNKNNNQVKNMILIVGLEIYMLSSRKTEEKETVE